MEYETEERCATTQCMEEDKDVEILQKQLIYLQDKVDRLVRDCKKFLTDKVLALRDIEVSLILD